MRKKWPFFALCDAITKLPTSIVLLMIFIFWYSATADLASGRHYSIENSLFLSLSPWGIILHCSKWLQIKEDTIWILFEVNSLFHCKVMMVFIAHKIWWIYLPLGCKYSIAAVNLWNFFATINYHNFGMKLPTVLTSNKNHVVSFSNTFNFNHVLTV